MFENMVEKENVCPLNESVDYMENWNEKYVLVSPYSPKGYGDHKRIELNKKK